MEMKISSYDGIRSYSRSVDSARIALAVVKAVETRKMLDLWSEEIGCFFSEIVKKLRNDNAEGLGAMKAPASYGAVSRALPFEFEGLVYRLVTGGEQKLVYQSTKRLVRAPGKLEGLEVSRPTRKPVGERIEESVTKALQAQPDKTAAHEEWLRALEIQITDIWHTLEKGGAGGTPGDVSEAMASIRMSFTDLYAQTAKLHARLQTLEDKISLF